MKQNITTEKMSLKSRIIIAWWCLIGQPFKTEPISKIRIIEEKEFYVALCQSIKDVFE